LRAWSSALGVALAFLVEAVTPLAQFPAGALTDVHAADCGKAQGVPLGISDTEIPSQTVSGQVPARDRGFYGDCAGLGLGDVAAHPLGRLHRAPDLILGLRVVPDKTCARSSAIRCRLRHHFGGRAMRGLQRALVLTARLRCVGKVTAARSSA